MKKKRPHCNNLPTLETVYSLEKKKVKKRTGTSLSTAGPIIGLLYNICSCNIGLIIYINNAGIG